MPHPNPGERHDDFIARCMSSDEAISSFPHPDQRYAVCQSFWDNKKMQHDDLLKLVRSRKSPGLRFGHGIITADRFASNVIDCVGTAVCKRYAPNGQTTALAIKEAAEKLAYTGDQLNVEKLATSEADIRQELKGAELPPHSMMFIKHVLTTPREDRDTDVLETSGAQVDTKMPLLWQHIHTLPIGKLVTVLEHTAQVLRMGTVLLDINELTSDAAKLVEADALRFSHGFRALKFTEMTKGFRVIEFEIMEESLVSVPSNVDAEVELYSRGKLKSDLCKMHAKALRSAMPKKFAGIGSSFAALKSAVAVGAISVKSGEQMAKALLTAPHDCDCPDKSNCGCHEKDANVSNGDDVFATDVDAEARAEVLGCEGCHEVAGGYRPCASPEIYQQYAGDVPALPALQAPRFSVSTDPTNKSYQQGSTVKTGDGKQGVISMIHAGPVYDVTINGGETRQRLLESELTLVQGPDNGAYGEQNTTGTRPRAKMAGGIIRKMFNPATERLEPCSKEVDWAARFIGCGVKDLAILNTACGGIMRGGFMASLESRLVGSQVAETRNISDIGEESPPVHESIDISSKSRATFLTEGLRFIVGKGGWKFVYRTWEGWGGNQYFAVYSEDREKAQAFIDSIWQDLEANNPLKGEAFALAGGFIKRSGTGFDEIFLESKNADALKRTVRIINSKGKSAANRGVILQGPPGTGKTLGARVVMNQADATYIWVSAKDFFELGPFSCFSHSFELARKLAPAVVLFEDVDNFMSDVATDLLKGEMDGLAQSSGVTTLLTTNFPERLPAALLDRPGRFHDVLEFHLPGKEVRATMLSKWASDASAATIMDLAEKTDGLSGAHIFELAAFAKTIRDEDDIEVDAALVRALAKVHEQRELISQNQLAGSSYRPRQRSAMVSAKNFAGPWNKAAVPYKNTPMSNATTWDGDAAVGRLRAWAGVNGDAPSAEAWAKYSQGFARKLGDGTKFGDYSLPHHDIEGGKIVLNRAGLAAAMAAVNGGRGNIKWESDAEKAAVHGHLARHYKDNDLDVPGDSESDSEDRNEPSESSHRPRSKAGRVLSQRNQDRLQEVHDNLQEMEGMDGMPRAAKSMAKDCRYTVKAIMDEATTPEADQPESQTSTEAAVKSILSEGDPVVLARVRDACEAILAVQKSDKRVEQFRRLKKGTPAPLNGSAGK